MYSYWYRSCDKVTWREEKIFYGLWCIKNIAE